MKNYVKWFGIIAFVAVIGFSIVGCDLFEEEPAGTFTLTNIPPAYNGKFASLYAASIFIGSQVDGSSTDPSKGIRYTPIINGEVEIPLWKESDGKYKRYDGDDGGMTVYIGIYNSDTPNDANIRIARWESNWRDVTFKKGSAKGSWNAGSHSE